MTEDTSGKYGFTDWEAEKSLGNDDDREGVYFLTIVDPHGEEHAVIIHRTAGGRFPLDGEVAAEKVARAERIVAALNDHQAREGSVPVWVDPTEVAEMGGGIGQVFAYVEDNPGKALPEGVLVDLERSREVANLIGNDFETYEKTGHSPLSDESAS